MPKLPEWLVWSLGLLVIVFLGVATLKSSYELKSLVNQNPKNTLSVSAEGKASGVPDLATVNLGVLTSGRTAQEVQDQSSKKMNAIVEFVKKQGVKAEDIATSQFNIYPQQDYRSGSPLTTGYQAITVKVRGVDKSTESLGKILSGATAAGANQVNGVSLSFDDSDNLRQQARKQAIAKAKDKAAELAAAAGLRLGRVVNVSEAGVPLPGPVPYAQGLGGSADAKVVPPEIQTGNQDVLVQMTLVFEIR